MSKKQLPLKKKSSFLFNNPLQAKNKYILYNSFQEKNVVITLKKMFDPFSGDLEFMID